MNQAVGGSELRARKKRQVSRTKVNLTNKASEHEQNQLVVGNGGSNHQGGFAATETTRDYRTANGNVQNCNDRTIQQPSTEQSFTEGNEFFSFPCNPIQLRRQKRNFFLFVRILFKYMEHRDKAAHDQLKNAVMRDMAVAYHRGAQQDDRDALGTIFRIYGVLKSSVSRVHWDSACIYHRMFLVKKRQQRPNVAPSRGNIIPLDNDSSSEPCRIKGDSTLE